MDFTIFDIATGRIRLSGSFADETEAALNCPPGCGVIAGAYDPELFDVIDGVATPLPPSPGPTFMTTGHQTSGWMAGR